MERFTILVITALTLLVGVCLATPAPAPQEEREYTNFPILAAIIDFFAKIDAFISGIIGEIINFFFIGGDLESELALGNEDPDGRR